MPSAAAPAAAADAAHHPATPRKSCRHWALGKCRWGAQCKYVHDSSQGATVCPRGKADMKWCNRVFSGCCTFGDRGQACEFWHIGEWARQGHDRPLMPPLLRKDGTWMRRALNLAVCTAVEAQAVSYHRLRKILGKYRLPSSADGDGRAAVRDSDVVEAALQELTQVMSAVQTSAAVPERVIEAIIAIDRVLGPFFEPPAHVNKRKQRQGIAPPPVPRRRVQVADLPEGLMSPSSSPSHSRVASPLSPSSLPSPVLCSPTLALHQTAGGPAHGSPARSAPPEATSSLSRAAVMPPRTHSEPPAPTGHSPELPAQRPRDARPGLSGRRGSTVAALRPPSERQQQKQPQKQEKPQPPPPLAPPPPPPQQQQQQQQEEEPRGVRSPLQLAQAISPQLPPSMQLSMAWQQRYHQLLQQYQGMPPQRNQQQQPPPAHMQQHLAMEQQQHCRQQAQHHHQHHMQQLTRPHHQLQHNNDQHHPHSDPNQHSEHAEQCYEQYPPQHHHLDGQPHPSPQYPQPHPSPQYSQTSGQHYLGPPSELSPGFEGSRGDVLSTPQLRNAGPPPGDPQGMFSRRRTASGCAPLPAINGSPMLPPAPMGFSGYPVQSPGDMGSGAQPPLPYGSMSGGYDHGTQSLCSSADSPMYGLFSPAMQSEGPGMGSPHTQSDLCGCGGPFSSALQAAQSPQHPPLPPAARTQAQPYCHHPYTAPAGPEIGQLPEAARFSKEPVQGWHNPAAEGSPLEQSRTRQCERTPPVSAPASAGRRSSGSSTHRGGRLGTPAVGRGNQHAATAVSPLTEAEAEAEADDGEHDEFLASVYG